MVSLQLADFGTEVIKIVDPKRGDPPVVERAQLLLERETAIAAREARMRSLAGG
jgi:crotonobetainyl-CoA:carnitine CoA-transferase CaiB-like acyl-CoA transferase